MASQREITFHFANPNGVKRPLRTTGDRSADEAHAMLSLLQRSKQRLVCAGAPAAPLAKVRPALSNEAFRPIKQPKLPTASSSDGDGSAAADLDELLGELKKPSHSAAASAQPLPPPPPTTTAAAAASEEHFRSRSDTTVDTEAADTCVRKAAHPMAAACTELEGTMAVPQAAAAMAAEARVEEQAVAMAAPIGQSAIAAQRRTLACSDDRCASGAAASTGFDASDAFLSDEALLAMELPEGL